jgi:hypothetical protein
MLLRVCGNLERVEGEVQIRRGARRVESGGTIGAVWVGIIV